MVKKSVVLVARDISPSKAFGEHLKPELEKRGILVKDFLGSGKPLSSTIPDIEKAVSGAGVVVSGMSSSEELAEPEIAACGQALASGIPFGFYGDTYHCHERASVGSWFAPFRSDAKFFFGINREEINAANFVFTNPSLVSVATGNPIWENYASPEFTREEVRIKYGVTHDEVLVLAPGIKSPAVNIMIWGLLVDAMALWEQKSRIMIAYHPGDRTPPDIYNDLKKFSTVPVKFLPSNVKTSDVLPGADVVVEWSSSIAIEAVHQRIPVISVSTEVGRKRLFSIAKTEKWEPCELGVAHEVFANPVELARSIKFLTRVGGNLRNLLLRRQAEIYPKPREKGAAVKKMADILERLMK